MATNTENYGLVKPDDEDFYNVEDFNGNADKIDAALKVLADAMGDNAALEEIKVKVDVIGTNIGKTTDTGGTQTAGSLMAKANTVIGLLGNVEGVLNSL